MFLVLDKVKKDGENFVTDHWIKAAGRFIQQQELGMMCKCRSNRKLHLHAARISFDRFIRGQLEASEV